MPRKKTPVTPIAEQPVTEQPVKTVPSDKPQPATTLIDALHLAYILREHRETDKARLDRAFDIVKSAFDALGDYDIVPQGTRYGVRRVYYRVIKFEGSKQIGFYTIRLNSLLACDCPDVQQNGVINCKHVLAVQLWQSAKDIFDGFVRTL